MITPGARKGEGGKGKSSGWPLAVRVAAGIREGVCCVTEEGRGRLARPYCHLGGRTVELASQRPWPSARSPGQFSAPGNSILKRLQHVRPKASEHDLFERPIPGQDPR